MSRQVAVLAIELPSSYVGRDNRFPADVPLEERVRITVLTYGPIAAKGIAVADSAEEHGQQFMAERGGRGASRQLQLGEEALARAPYPLGGPGKAELVKFIVAACTFSRGTAEPVTALYLAPNNQAVDDMAQRFQEYFEKLGLGAGYRAGRVGRIRREEVIGSTNEPPEFDGRAGLQEVKVYCRRRLVNGVGVAYDGSEILVAILDEAAKDGFGERHGAVCQTPFFDTVVHNNLHCCVKKLIFECVRHVYEVVCGDSVANGDVDIRDREVASPGCLCRLPASSSWPRTGDAGSRDVETVEETACIPIGPRTAVTRFLVGLAVDVLYFVDHAGLGNMPHVRRGSYVTTSKIPRSIRPLHSLLVGSSKGRPGVVTIPWARRFVASLMASCSFRRSGRLPAAWDLEGDLVRYSSTYDNNGSGLVQDPVDFLEDLQTSTEKPLRFYARNAQTGEVGRVVIRRDVVYARHLSTNPPKAGMCAKTNTWSLGSSVPKVKHLQRKLQLETRRYLASLHVSHRFSECRRFPDYQNGACAEVTPLKS
ncbi:hypothetical protein LX32DRAFT_658159 [Colletotrichum zoysiae]|uniref:Uncharacterized protein n=1 Tax=Colletotrichum zoysiae TaxID=1216348 RepID=A0AAD9H4S4_9PEZI|nr:hypothetical protein LX32DRAFT_658159 [Colletotrichum zoysiae]